MRRNILFILLLFAALVTLLALQKPIFLLWYAPLAAEADLTELLGVITNGVSLDMTVAGYVCAPVIIISLLALWLPHKVWGALCRWWLYISAALLALNFTVNLGLYDYWRFPLDSSILQYLATPREAMASVTVREFFVQCVVAVVYCAAIVVVVKALLNLYEGRYSIKLWRKAAYTLLLLLFVGLDFLAIRGGVSTAVANVSKVYFSDNIFLNHAAVNPTFSFLSSLSGEDDLSRYNYFEQSECDRQFSEIMGNRGAKPAENLLNKQRPNIVMIIAESFGRSTTDEAVDGRAVAPHLQQLKSEGVWFENMIASSFRTDRGVLATLSGFCSQPTMSVMKYPQRASHLPSIAGALRDEGYSTSYIHGGDLNFTDMASYLYATGFERLVALKDLSFDAPKSKWGYADDVLSDYFIDFVEKKAEETRPFFAVWQTLSSHEPFDVPQSVFEDKMLNSMHFADSCIARVVDALKSSKQWDNTLVIIIADHAYLYPYGIAASAAERHRIPMLWTGGAVKEAKTIDRYCSQTDLAATLLSQLGIDYRRFTMSRNIFAEDIEPFGYYTFNNGFGVVKSHGTTIYDCTTESVISDYSSAADIVTGKTLLQTTYNIINKL